MNTIDCGEARELLPAYVDGELDLPRALALERHLEGCTSCTAELRGLRALRKVVRGASYHRAPDTLRARLRRQLPEASPPPAVAPSRRGLWAPWAGALAASLALAIGLNVFLAGRQSQAQLEDELVAGHVRSLQAGHLEDVASSDHHTVKPWFTGKLDFSPPVHDLAAQGFALAGGRLDYLDDRAVAALVYRHGLHTINLFIWPVASTTPSPPTLERRKGYNLLRWSDHGMQFWAVSDMDATEMQRFAGLLEAQTP